MAEDEGRFGLISVMRRCWAPRPLRPTVPQQMVYEAVYVFAAVCPQLGQITALILPYANSDMMTLFLRQVASDLPDHFIVMLVDQAGWHLGKDVNVPENIRLIPQPAGSPELNPAEHIWEDLRENEIGNQLFTSLDELEDTLCHGINRLASHPDKLRSLTDFPYLKLRL
jgi:transposase